MNIGSGLSSEPRARFRSGGLHEIVGRPANRMQSTLLKDRTLTRYPESPPESRRWTAGARQCCRNHKAKKRQKHFGTVPQALSLPVGAKARAFLQASQTIVTDARTARLRRLFVALAAVAASFVSATGTELLPAARLGRGISVHEVLNWPEMKHGPQSSPSYVWPPFASERYALHKGQLTALKQVGFNTVRLTVGLGIFLSANAEERTQLDSIVVDRVSQLIGAGFEVIIDFHPMSQDARFPPLAFTRGPGQPLVESFRDLLMRTATNLSRLPRDRVVLEILNEPTTHDWGQSETALWQTTQKSYFDSIRSVAPDLTVIVTGCCSCCGLELMALDPANYPGPNVYFTFHFYSPHAFTHQGAFDRSNPLASTRFVSDVRFPLDPGGLADLERRARASLEGENVGDLQSRLRAEHGIEVAVSELREVSTSADIDRVFDQNLDWARAHGISPQRLFLGEFGVMRPNVDPASRRNWLETVREAAERRKMPWAYWCLEGPDGMGLQLDRSTGVFDPLILDALGMTSH
jgi:endoglucanase